MNSRRTLTLPALVVDALKADRVRQFEERMRTGAEWINAHELVFTTPNGRPLNPSHVRDVLAGLLARAELTRMKYHALRHTAATLLLADGTPLFDMSRVLCHSQIGTTADI